MKKMLVVSIILIVVLSGCSSLPSPETPNSTLLVIYVAVDHESGGQPFRYYKLYMDNGEELAKLYASDGLVFVTNLPAGKHVVKKLKSIHKKHVRTRESDVYIPFEMRSKSITVFPQKLKVTIRRENTKSKSTYYQYWDFIDLNSDDKDKINNLLRQQGNYKLWDI